MQTSDFYYDLPQELIAQTPVEPRDSSRLMVIHRDTGVREHRIFRDVIDYLNPGDALVINNTRTIPARLIGHKTGTGGVVEFLLLRRRDYDTWEALVRPGKRLQPGAQCEFGEGALRAEIVERTSDDGGRLVKFHFDGVFEEILDRLGTMPLPPYIHEKLEDPQRYNTVYAKTNGSAATPTAGLHFTPELLERIRRKGIDVVPVLLHVGLGTFRPVKEDEIENHEMHSEFCIIPENTARTVTETKQNGGRIVAVGTTSCRTLESFAKDDGTLEACSDWTDIFIYPGYSFKCIDALVTNFHLPESTLIMLVSALAGREHILNAYKTAVEEKYRFFSFGDAMFIK